MSYEWLCTSCKKNQPDLYRDGKAVCKIWRTWPNTPCPGCGHERHRKPKQPPTLAEEVREWFAQQPNARETLAHGAALAEATASSRLARQKTAATAPTRAKQAVKRIKTAQKQNNAVYGEIGDPFAVGE